MHREPSPELRRQILTYQWSESDAHDAMECAGPRTEYGTDYSRDLHSASNDVGDMIGRNGDVAYFTGVLVLRLWCEGMVEIETCGENLIAAPTHNE